MLQYYRAVLPKFITVLPSKTHHLRGDTIVAIGIPILCIGILIEAYYRTDYHDADTSVDAQFIPSNDCIDSYCRQCRCSTTTTIDNSHTSTITVPAEKISLSDLNRTNSMNKNMIVQTLERDGIVIIPNAIPPTILSAVRNNLLSLQQQQQQQAIPIGREDSNQKNITSRNHQPCIFARSGNDTDVRQDKIIWIRNDSNTRTGTIRNSLSDTATATAGSDGPDLELGIEAATAAAAVESTKSIIGCDLEYCINFIRGIPYALEKNGYTLSNDHRIPKQCQLSMYMGDNISSYQRHLDTCTSTMYDLGLLEYLRLSDYRQRRITIILYLNESHRPIRHGGTLRCWVSNELPNGGHPSPLPDSPWQDDLNNARMENSMFHPSLDIQPMGGTLVIFQSQR